jgi:hypothetical protein
MRATGDRGREAQLWLSGYLRDFDRIDYPVRAAAPEAVGSSSCVTYRAS